MPLSLPPPVASSLNELLLYTFREGVRHGLKDCVDALTPGKSADLNLPTRPLPPEISTCIHLEDFLLKLESLLLDCHHHTPQSPLTNQSTASFPPPLDSQDQL